MSSIANLCDSFANIMNIYENRSGCDESKSFVHYLSKRKYRPIDNFGADMDWFNTKQSLTLHKHFKGKVVLLDFFTYCCINCMHILPHLNRIEHQFSIEDGFVVIGVHCAKFENEKQSENIRRAIERYSIEHPVVNDRDFKVWKNCSIHCWPSLLLLDPELRPICLFQGEGNYDLIRFAIEQSLNYFDSKQLLSKHSIPIALNNEILQLSTRLTDTVRLSFPAKIASFFNREYGFETIAIADTGNNRVLICDAVGNLVYEIGNGKAGFRDGLFSDCEFNKPYGLVFRNETELFVADSENHAIRSIDLNENRVRTIAGTGVQGHDRDGGRMGVDQALSSPWDLAIYDRNVLVIAMAGTHQIWGYFCEDRVWWKGERMKAGVCCRLAGSGREENRNNHYPKSAAFAQPSGLCIDTSTSDLYVADSESSAIRRLSLIDGKVTAVVGADPNPNNLFAFGDRDGKSTDAKLQHPLGVATVTACGRTNDTFIFVADSYNHKIKAVRNREIESVRLPDKLNEPHGLCQSQRLSNLLFVCDTNNHCVRKMFVDFDRSPKCLRLDEFRIRTGSNGFLPFDNDLLKIEFCRMHETFRFVFNFVFEQNLKLNENLKQICDVFVSNDNFEILKFDSNLKISQNQIEFRAKNLSIVRNSKNFVHLKCNLNLCNNEICLFKTFLIVIVLNFERDECDDGDGPKNGSTKEVSIAISENSIQLQN